MRWDAWPSGLSQNRRMRWAGKVWRRVKQTSPLTRTGVAYLCGMLMALAAFVSGNNLLFLILAAMVATLMVSGFISRLGLAGLELDLLLPQHTSARRRVRAGIRLRNAKNWIPSFSIHLEGAAESGFDSILYFPVIPGGTTIEESVQVFFPRRGAHTERSFRFTTRFPFGFTERSESVLIRHEVIVYPCLDAQPGFEALLASVTGDVEAMQRGPRHGLLSHPPVRSARKRPARGLASLGRTRANCRSASSRASRIAPC